MNGSRMLSMFVTSVQRATEGSRIQALLSSMLARQMMQTHFKRQSMRVNAEAVERYLSLAASICAVIRSGCRQA